MRSMVEGRLPSRSSLDDGARSIAPSTSLRLVPLPVPGRI